MPSKIAWQIHQEPGRAFAPEPNESVALTRHGGNTRGGTARHPPPNWGMPDLDAELQQFPWMGGPPHNRLALLMRRTKSLISLPKTSHTTIWDHPHHANLVRIESSIRADMIVGSTGSRLDRLPRLATSAICC